MEMEVMMHEKGLWHSFKEPAVVGKKQMWSPAQFITALRPDMLLEMELERYVCGASRLCATTKSSTRRS